VGEENFTALTMWPQCRVAPAEDFRVYSPTYQLEEGEKSLFVVEMRDEKVFLRLSVPLWF
jgi:hypothetical protein